jgi:hypothetical protein
MLVCKPVYKPVFINPVFNGPAESPVFKFSVTRTAGNQPARKHFSSRLATVFSSVKSMFSAKW